MQGDDLPSTLKLGMSVHSRHSFRCKILQNIFRDLVLVT